MKKLSLISVFFFFFAGVSSAQVSSVALPFIEIDHNPVTSAMAGVSMFRDVERGNISVSYQLWKPSTTSYFSADGVFRLVERFKLGFIGTYGRGQVYNGNQLPEEMRFGATFGAELTDFLEMDLDASYVSSRFYDNIPYYGFAVGAYLKARFGGIRIAAGVCNLGPEVKGNRLPSSVVLAIGYDNGKKPVHKLRPELDLKYYFCASFSLSAGMEYIYKGVFSARAGYHCGGVVANHASVGLGVNIRGIRVDASYIIGSGVIGNTVCSGLGYSF